MKRRRNSNRLRGFDYSTEGAYFITICVQDRRLLFEDEAVNAMIEKWWGRLPSKFQNVRIDEFVVMPNHVHGIVLIDDPKSGTTHGSSPTQTKTNVGADPRVRPEEEGSTHRSTPANEGEPGVGADPRVPPEGKGSTDGLTPTQSKSDVGAHQRVRPRQDDQPKTGTTHGSSPTDYGDLGDNPRIRSEGNVSLGRIVQWFKTMTTNEYIRRVKTDGWQLFPGRLWQRSYYDHIIRDETDLNRVRRYIQNNPARWQLDRYYQPAKD